MTSSDLVRIRSGDTLVVRPIRDDDALELQRAFALLSEVSRYRRFLTGMPLLSDKWAAYLSHVDHVDHVALVALPDAQSMSIVGVARYVRHGAGSTDADLAITVADEWHGRGLATALLALLTARARENGVSRFTVDMLADNAAVRAMVNRAGGVDDARDGSVVTGHISLAPTEIALAGAELLRAAARRSVIAVPHPVEDVVPRVRPARRAVVAL